MDDSNTLFILAKWGLKASNNGLFESHMWLLNEDECSMKYVSLHKSKSQRAWKGGEIAEIRLAASEEIEAHQSLLAEKGLDPMQVTEGRKVIVFRMIKNWKAIWPQHAKTNPMAYKGLGLVNEQN